MAIYEKLEHDIESIIDSLKGICSQNGLGNSADEETVITTVFLYKFLNDKFMFYIHEFADKNGFDYKEIFENKNCELDAFYDAYSGNVAFDYEDTIESLIHHASETNFYKLFDKALINVSDNPRNKDFNIETADGTKISLFEAISTKVEESSKDNFAKAIFSEISKAKFNFGIAFEDGNGFDFYSRIFEYLIKDYNVASGIYAEYFTPQSVSNIVAKILVGMSEKITASEIYDPSAGSGSLVLHLANELGKDSNISRAIVYTQDISKKSSRFLRINLLLNGLTDSLGNAIKGDTLVKPAHRVDENDSQSELKKFDYIVANPPFKLDFSSTRDQIENKWGGFEDASGEKRFFAGVPKIVPEKKDSMPIYLLFVQHIIFSMKGNGKAAVIVPTGFLTAKNGIEKTIREKLINEKWLNGVIIMPKNIFATTGTQVAVLFIDKSILNETPFLMDASSIGKQIKEGKNKKTVLDKNDISNIVNSYLSRIPEANKSVLVSCDKISKKNYSFSAGQFFNAEVKRRECSNEILKNDLASYKKTLTSLSSKSATYNKDIFEDFNKICFVDTKLVFDEKIEKNVPEGWSVHKMSECISRISTGLNPRDHFKLGIGNIKYVTVKNLCEDGTLDFSGCDTIDESALKLVHKRSDIQQGDILFASIAPLGRCYLIQEEPVGWDINESVFTIRPNLDIITAEYLYMYLTSKQFIKNAEDNSTGSIFKGIRQSDLLDLMIALPPRDVMEKISAFIRDFLGYKKLIDDSRQCFIDVKNNICSLFLEGQAKIDK